MLSNCIIDFEKEVGRHIELAKSLTERNEFLFSKVGYLRLQLKERDGELQKERRTVEDHLQDKAKQSAEIERLRNRCEKLEKDMTLMKQTAQETKNSSVVSNFSSAMTMNLKNISHLKIDNKQLKSTVKILEGNQRNTDRLIEQNNTLIQKMMKEQDQLKIELNTAIERERSSRLNLKDSIEQKYYSIDKKVDSMQIRLNRLSGKFVFVSNWDSGDCLSSDNVERVYFFKDKLESLVHSISSYKRELFILTHWEYTNITTGQADRYAKLLSLCLEWKRLRPDGEIHCLYWYRKFDSLPNPSKELTSLLTTCNEYLDTGRASHISAIRKCWPKFADLILSEKIKNEYPI